LRTGRTRAGKLDCAVAPSFILPKHKLLTRRPTKVVHLKYNFLFGTNHSHALKDIPEADALSGEGQGSLDTY
jgi:hypothetical protein